MSAFPTYILDGFDFDLLSDSGFKEDSVREELVVPLLKGLGYQSSGDNRVIRSKKLTHPVVTTGAGNRQITNYPDYLLQVNGESAWVLDAKGPDEDIVNGKNVEQAYFYAIHPEVRVSYYALCNGKQFALFTITEQSPVLHFNLQEIEKHWVELNSLLSPSAFPREVRSIRRSESSKQSFDYIGAKPLGEIKGISKQSAKRHFGVHGYFTKQAWQVVSRYIENFSRPADIVLDPFGGTGVTLIEALILGRRAIHIDINPLSIFIVKTLLLPTDFSLLHEEFAKIRERFNRHCPQTDEEIEKALQTYWYPSGIPLMKNADVDTIEKLFSPVQLAQLAYLRHLIKGVRDEPVRQTLFLMFSGLLNKINLTYHASGERSPGRGDSAMFRYYRFRIAPTPASLNLMTYFESRLKKVTAAKQEIARHISDRALEYSQVVKGSATDLNQIEDESVDYIYTDPPYGSKIPYLDLSVLWNSWLELPVTEDDYQLEAIEGGELNKSKVQYAELITNSVREMYRTLKFDRWMSFVFAHKDPAYWHMIVEAAEKAGFQYAGAVAQNNGQSSFKKRQNPFTVLHGQLIINFKKVRNPVSLAKFALGADITNIIVQTVEGIIAKEHGATIEQINNELIIKGLELGFLDILSQTYQDITPFLLEFLDFDDETQRYQIRKNQKFRTHIDVKLRVRYYTYSYLKRLSYQNYDPTFDEIVLHIMPLLKNGVTPENQTVSNVLEELADRVGEDRWRLKEFGQRSLFGENIK